MIIATAKASDSINPDDAKMMPAISAPRSLIFPPTFYNQALIAKIMSGSCHRIMMPINIAAIFHSSLIIFSGVTLSISIIKTPA